MQVHGLVAKAVASTPSLAPLADPVTLQLITYLVMGAPVALILLLPLLLLLCCG